MSEGEKLRAVATLNLSGRTFDVAKNGGYHLVVEAGRDAYDRPVARRVPLSELNAEERQAMLDCLGEALEKLQGHEAARERRLGDVL